MDANFVVEIFQNLGVPEACLVFCGWVIVRQDTKHREEVDQLATTIEGI